MTIKRKDFQKAAAVIHEFQMKLSEDVECAELRDALNLALLHMQKYYRLLRSRLQTHDRTNGQILTTSVRGLSPMTPFKDAPDKFQWRWINLDSLKVAGSLPLDVSREALTLPRIIQATKEGNNEMILQLLDDAPDMLAEVDGMGRNVLHYAVQFGHLDTLQILLEQGIDVNMIAHDGSTAVHRACHNGNHEALQILIEYDADLSVQDNQGRAPIHWACTPKERNCLRSLLDNGVSTTVRDQEGMSALMWACRMDHIDHFQLLSEIAAQRGELDEEDFEHDHMGRTWMHWSVRRTEPLECLRTLLNDEAACYRDDEGKSVMHVAAESGSLPASQVIVDIAGKSCLEHRDMENRTPLILATMGGHGEVVNYLLSDGADLANVDNNGATAWDYARGRQLHYCMLILASYIRQRAKTTSSEEGEPMMTNVAEDMELQRMMHGENIPIGQLQIAEGQETWHSNPPIVPPHPPTEPATPRTPHPHTPSTPRGRSRTPATPRGVPTPPRTPQAPTTPRAPATPRSYGVKRSPSYSLENNQENDSVQESTERSSSGGKRKRNDDDRERIGSVMSFESADFRQDNSSTQDNFVDQGEHEMVADSEYLEGPVDEEELDHESVSISAMDVSDIDGEDDDHHGDVEDLDDDQSPTTPHPPPSPHPRYNWNQPLASHAPPPPPPSSSSVAPKRMARSNTANSPKRHSNHGMDKVDDLATDDPDLEHQVDVLVVHDDLSPLDSPDSPSHQPPSAAAGESGNSHGNQGKQHGGSPGNQGQQPFSNQEPDVMDVSLPPSPSESPEPLAKPSFLKKKPMLGAISNRSSSSAISSNHPANQSQSSFYQHQSQDAGDEDQDGDHWEDNLDDAANLTPASHPPRDQGRPPSGRPPSGGPSGRPPSGQSNNDGGRVLPPAHLTPLTGGGSPRKKKKKKKKHLQQFNNPFGQTDTPPSGNYASPISPPRTNPIHNPPPMQMQGSGMSPTPLPRPRDRSRSPSRKTMSELANDFRSTGENNVTELHRPGSGGQGQGQQGSRPSSVKSNSKSSSPHPPSLHPQEQRFPLDQNLKVKPGSLDAGRSSGGKSQAAPVTSPRTPPLPQVAPRRGSGLASPKPGSGSSTQRSGSGTSSRLNDSRNRGSGDGFDSSKPSPAPRGGSSGKNRYNLPNGSLQNGPLSKDQSRGYNKQQTNSSQGFLPSGAKQRGQQSPSPRQSAKSSTNSVPPINQKLPNGRLPPTY